MLKDRVRLQRTLCRWHNTSHTLICRSGHAQGAAKGFKDGLKEGNATESSDEHETEKNLSVSEKTSDTTINVRAKDKS